MTFVLTNNFILSKVLAAYETPFTPLVKDKVYDYAIVLGGASGYDSFSRTLQLNASAERLVEPVALWRKGIVKKLLISGGSANVFPPYIKDAIYVRKFWLDMGVPDSCILIETESRNTIENAKFSKQLIEKKGEYKNVLLITSALHMPRSKYIFNKAGVEVDIYPVDFLVSRVQYRTFNIINFLIPKSAAIVGWENLIHEWVGMLAAR